MDDERLRFDEAQAEFLKLIDRVQPKDISEFLVWVQDSFAVDKNGQQQMIAAADASSVNEAVVALQSIASNIRCELPISAVFDSESCIWPEYGLDADCKPETTVHVDSFLYDEDDVNELVDQGRLDRNYCRACGSHSTQPLTFISHSLSIDQLRFIFTVLLPPNVLCDKVVLDVGSRLGAVLYAAYLFSAGRVKLIGIELNEQMCELQKRTADKMGIDDILIINDDMRNRPVEVGAADIIVLNNVFQFFLTPQDQRLCWQFLRQHLKQNAIVVTNPSIAETTEYLQLDFALDEWLEQVPTELLAAKFALTDSDLFDDCSKISLYTVRTRQ